MTMTRREWLASSALLAAACARQGESAISSKNAPAERLDIPTLLQLASVPGMAIATVHGGDVAVEGSGIRRAGTDGKVTGDTVFEAASLSKPVFASIVMQLATEGVIDLTRPLASWRGRRRRRGIVRRPPDLTSGPAAVSHLSRCYLAYGNCPSSACQEWRQLERCGIGFSFRRLLLDR